MCFTVAFLSFFFFLSSFQVMRSLRRRTSGLTTQTSTPPKTSPFRKCTLLPQTRPHLGRVVLLGEPAPWEGRWQNLFVGEVPSLLPLPTEARATTAEREEGTEVLGSWDHRLPGSPRCKGDRKICEDGNYSGGRRKDIGSWVCKTWVNSIGKK